MDSYVAISCNTGTSDLPDMYAQSSRDIGSKADNMHIRQITSAREYPGNFKKKSLKVDQISSEQTSAADKSHMHIHLSYNKF